MESVERFRIDRTKGEEPAEPHLRHMCVVMTAIEGIVDGVGGANAFELYDVWPEPVAKVTQGVSPGGNGGNLRLCLQFFRAENFGHVCCVLPNQREEKCQQPMLELDKLMAYTE